jgi:hypothetical protein
MKHPQVRTFNPWRWNDLAARRTLHQLLPKFESRAKAERERSVRIDDLDHFGSADHRRLARILRSCDKSRRCLLSVCPLCMRRLRLWWANESLKFWHRYPGLIFVTLIDAGQIVAADQLQTLHPKRLNDALRQRLHRIPINAPVLGGLDLDFDEKSGIWRPHHHLIVPASQESKIRNVKDRFYQRTREVYAPVRIEPVRDHAKPMSYCLKGFSPRIVRFKDSSGNPRTRPCRLKGPMHADWLLWKSQFSGTDFLFLFGVRRIGSVLG